MVPWFPWFLEFVPGYLEMVPGYPDVVLGYLGGVLSVRALAINLWYGSDIFRGPLPLGKKCSLTKCDVMGHKH